MFSFGNMESHGEPIKLVLCKLVTWTPPKEVITLLELFGGIGTCLKALLQWGMVVQRYFYVDIDPIGRQVVALRMIKLTTKFPQHFATTAWKASFTFLPFDIQLIWKKHMELLGPVDLIISGWECQGFSYVFSEWVVIHENFISTLLVHCIHIYVHASFFSWLVSTFD